MAAPRIRLYVAVSLDGFIASRDGGVGWLEPFSADYGYDAFFASVDTLVMGRATYDQVVGLGAWPYEGKLTRVLTSRALQEGADGVERWPWGVMKLCEQLRANAEGDVWIVGGGKAVRGFIDADAVDDMELYVMPCLLGDGVRLFEPGTRALSLALVDTHAYPDGVVRMRYRTIREDEQPVSEV